ncbi:MAG: glycoside hydrolase N-terminal domain-containing protein [Clostridia bacterium]|nr:glycoside hydrolase N-terminal domain-containing protein [Clostridia bacterium]
MELLLRYRKPAPDTPEGWERESMPIGNSYMGGNVFGGVEYERIQITENSLENPGYLGGLNSFADIFLRFLHRFEAVTQYERGLNIGEATAYVRYDADGVHMEREYFASYPDRTVAGRITASVPVSFFVELQIPFLTEEEGREKRGEVTSSGNTITMQGVMCHYNVRFAAQLRVITDGQVCASEGGLQITDATETTFVFCGATNYELRPEVFLEKDDQKKLRDFSPMPLVQSLCDSASAKTYDALRASHIADHSALFGRVELNLGEIDVPAEMTDELLAAYAEGKPSRYLEVLYFQYGRYLLIASSRPGCLPANLQGVWNCHDRSPWGAGYWHNINVQMNYWPAFITNLAETFEAYRDFNEAFRPAGEEYARQFVRNTVPENDTDEPGGCGWTIGTASYAYGISGPGGHSGPGTGGLTTKLFWDAYAFTADKEVLRRCAYPALLSMTKHLLRVVREYDGLYLSVFSASPEQIICNNWTKPVQYYHTVGCAFDQQMIWENGRDLLECVSLIGEENLPPEDLSVIRALREQIDRYDPVQVGWSGQIKEYREENFYGEVGEYRHRHISQLVGLYPGTLIGRETPAWLDAAKVTLDFRSDQSTGWALAHRLNAWARTGDGNRAYRLYGNLLGQRTLPNLWDTHPPFQIDGNFGGTSGVSEMLLQSHESYIAPLACLPDAWKDGAYRGLCARGGFVFDVSWSQSCADTITVHSRAGGVCRIRYPGIAGAAMDVPFTVTDRDRIAFETEAGGVYHITAIPAWEKKPTPDNLRATRQLDLTWDFDGAVNLWRAADSASCYTLVAANVTGGAYTDTAFDFSACETVTYKITRADAADSGEMGACVTLNHSTALQRQRYRFLVTQLNATCGGAKAPDYLGE